MATILVIDDEAAIRRLILRVLRPRGHALLEAEDGEQGLMLMKDRPLDLIITDIYMPGKEGIETIREALDRAPGTKIIAMSGGCGSRNLMFLDMAETFGAQASLAKPFLPQELIETVDRVLAGR
ncbi:MAG TPA: response regulator [Stellaceae bacterium]|nr:response regulator [Stellaceae bacterium]